MPSQVGVSPGIYALPSKSGSTEHGEHDYSNSHDRDVELSLSAHLEQYNQTAAAQAVPDQMSPTSIYTTESEMPFDEKQSYEMQKDLYRKYKEQRNQQQQQPQSKLKQLLKALHIHQADSGQGHSSTTSSETPTQTSTLEASKTGGPNKNKNKNKNNKITRTPCCSWWTWLTEHVLHDSIKRAVVYLATRAARYPYTTIASMSFVSVLVLVVGFFTNFELIVDSDAIYTPLNTLAEEHHDWLTLSADKGGSGFNNIRPVLMILHKEGENVLQRESIAKLFQAVDTVRQTPGYQQLCEQGSHVSYDNQHTCRIFSATRFWNHNETWFDAQIQSDEQLIDILSSTHYQDDSTPVFHEMILGNAEWIPTSTTMYNASSASDATLRLASVQSLFVRIELPDSGPEADDFETRALDNLHMLQQQWQENTNKTIEETPLQLDFLSIFAYKIENQRALIQDLPLVTGIFAILLLFTTLVFWKKHPVYSRSMLGCASLATIGMSLALSYGIVWCIGIPFTNIAQILPFMVMGVGLDDTFIVTGAYFRTDPNLNIEHRIETTMNEVGLSISLTSITTMVAFMLGSTSNIPGVKSLCWYAFFAIAIDFLFQVTFFVSLLTLDERRLQSYRKTWCCWKRIPVDVDECESQMGIILSSTSTRNSDQQDFQKNPSTVSASNSTSNDAFDANDKSKHFSERLMIWYGRQLLKPWCKVLVLLSFSAYFVFCCYRTTFLKQEFNVEDYTPADSYLRGTLQSLDDYYSLTKPLEVYFRNVNQSDPEIQQQMRDYVDELAALPQIGEDAPFCWVRDFENLMDEYPEYAFLQNLTFSQQLRAALSNPTIREVYGEDIVINEYTGEIDASRCLLFLRNVDLTDVKDQIDTLMGQRDVTLRQPINKGHEDLPFFAFDTIFFYWELYAQAVDELVLTIFTGVVAVTLVTFVLVPHWSATLFVCPGIVIMYMNFLGTMEWMGLYINSLTYVIIVMAIGLLVDFLVHILLRYYETECTTRDKKVKEALRTMGASMFVGGLTTFLGVCPLVLSSTHIFMTVFWAFAAIVVLGFAHGVILLPVVLSLVGPVATHQKQRTADDEAGGIPAKIVTPKHTGAGKRKPSSSPTTFSKVEVGIKESSSEEKLEEFSQNEHGQDRTRMVVPFIGPSYDLDLIDEGAENSRPSSTSSAANLSRDASSSTRTAAASAAASNVITPVVVPRSLLGSLADAYNCSSDIDFYNVVKGACT